MAGPMTANQLDRFARERLDLDYAIAVLFGNQQARQARQEAARAA
jgi:hypothetical protein